MSRADDELPNADKIHIAIREARKIGLSTIARLDRKSSLSVALKTEGAVNWNRSICPLTGQLVGSLDEDAGRRKANNARKNATFQRAEDASKRYGADWYSRSLTKKIAQAEGVDPRTIRRWRQITKKTDKPSKRS